MHAAAFVILMISCIVGFALHSYFLRELRSRHPDIWESLGRPTLIMNNSISNGLAVQRFLWRREYESLDDPEFVQLSRVLRTFGIAYLVLFALIVLGFFIGIALDATRTI
jgi:hypothetical protein